MINIGLIGYGYWGPNIAKNLHANEKINLKYICDKSTDSIAKAKLIFLSQVEYTDDFNQIINDPDIHAIAIAVQTSVHYYLVRQALLKGKHVFVEKPFTSSVNEAIELDELAKSLNLKIHVNHIMIFHPAIKKIKELIVSNQIGDLLCVNAMRINLGPIKKDVSAMWDLALHDLAIIDYLTEGSEPYFVSLVGEKLYNPKESLSFLSLRYKGFIAHIQSSWISPLKERKLTIVGSKKMIIFDDMKNSEKLTIYHKNFELVLDKNMNYEQYSVQTHEGDVWSPYLKQEDALYNSIEYFRKVVEENYQSISGTVQAIRIQKILEKADIGAHDQKSF